MLTDLQSQDQKCKSNHSVDSARSLTESEQSELFQESQLPDPTDWLDLDSDKSVDKINPTTQLSNGETKKSNKDLCEKRNEIEIRNDKECILKNDELSLPHRCKKRKTINAPVTNNKTENKNEDIMKI